MSSFHNAEYASIFAAQLCGKSVADFETIAGELQLRDIAEYGTCEEAEALCSVDLDAFYSADHEERRLNVVNDF